MGTRLTKADILKKLETIYRRVLNIGIWHVTLWSAELQGQAVGLFEKHLLPKAVRIAAMRQEQVTEFMDCLEKHDPIVKDQGGEAPKEGPLPEKELDGEEADFKRLKSTGEAATPGESVSARPLEGEKPPPSAYPSP